MKGFNPHFPPKKFEFFGVKHVSDEFFLKIINMNLSKKLHLHIYTKSHGKNPIKHPRTWS